MPRYPRPRRPVYISVGLPRLTKRQKLGVRLIIVSAALLAFLIQAGLYVRKLSGAIALSDATDLVTYAINDLIHDKMDAGEYNYDRFVTLERNGAGDIVAITSNMSEINAMSSALLQEVVDVTDKGGLDIGIPMGTLTGLSILNDRGPDVDVKVIMLTSSRADFKNELISAGINQTKHQILLEVTVDIDVVLPWQTLSTQVLIDMLVAETVIVGKVPETFISGSNVYGSYT